jgi:carboxymethylenebutenolidase
VEIAMPQRTVRLFSGLEERNARRSVGVVLCLLATTCCVMGLLPKMGRPVASLAAEPSQPGRELPPLPPFLEIFSTSYRITIKSGPAEWISATGKQEGYLARPDGGERLPALIVVADEHGLSNWLRLTARELAGIGYVVLAVELDDSTLRDPSQTPATANRMVRERQLANLSAAVRWLRRRKDVLPKQMGALGWSAGGRWALSLAATEGLEACVVCDGLGSADPAILAGLRHTAVLGISSGAAEFLAIENQAAFHQALESDGVEQHLLVFKDAKPGFMDPDNKPTFRYDDAERGWFEIYEFFAKHVEDAPLKALLAARSAGSRPLPQQVATITDLMRSVNAPTGLRGELARSLGDEPKDDNEWKAVRSRAALLAETGNLLLDRTPPRGEPTVWQRSVAAYGLAAKSLVTAADRQDYAAALTALKQLTTSCGACHLKHR